MKYFLTSLFNEQKYTNNNILICYNKVFLMYVLWTIEKKLLDLILLYNIM